MILSLIPALVFTVIHGVKFIPARGVLRLRRGILFAASGSWLLLSVALVVSLTLAFTVICAKLIGAALPIFAKKIHLDPAVMASPFITTIVDAVSLLVYFGVATSLLSI